MNDQAKGLTIVAIGVLILSPDAALIRLISVDAWTLLWWRGLGVMSVLLAFSLIRHGRRLPAVLRGYGLAGPVIGLCYSGCQIGFVSGVSHTNPANVLVLVAATPIFAALFSRFLLAERLDRATAIAIAVGLVGVVVTLSGSFNGFGRWQGDLMGLAVPICLALAFTLSRRLTTDVWAAFALSGIVTCTIAWGPASPLAPAGQDIWLIAVLVLVVSPVSFALISLGPRFIPAAEVSLLMLLETVLGAVWVWLLVAEPPSPQAVVGGAIILTTLAWHARRSLKRPDG